MSFRRVALFLAALTIVTTPVVAEHSTSAATGVQIGIGDSTVYEGDAIDRSLTFPITLSKGAAATITVDATVVAGSATAGTDYKIIATKRITFLATQTYKPFVVTLIADTVDESDESFAVVLSGVVGTANLGRSVASGTIKDDDAGSGVRLAIGDGTGVETDSGKAKITVWATLSRPSSGIVTATVAVTAGTAIANVDFKPVLANIKFPAGVVKKPIGVAIMPDAADESEETVIVNLYNVVGATSLDTVGSGIIHDDDGLVNLYTATYRLGPFNLGPEGTSNDESNSAQNNIPKPSGAFGVTSMRFDIVHSDSSLVGHHDVHLHHVVLLDSSRPDTLCPSLPNRFNGAGAERTNATFGTEFAYKVGPTDQWTALWHIMNTSNTTHNVYIEYEIDYVTGVDLIAAKPLTSYFYDVDDCWGDSQFAVPGGGAIGSTYSKSINYTAPRGGVRVYSGAHLHDGGIDLTMTQAGTEICRGEVMYDAGMIHHISDCENPVTVRAGQQIGLTARYSNVYAIPDAMGISVSMVWEP